MQKLVRLKHLIWTLHGETNKKKFSEISYMFCEVKLMISAKKRKKENLELNLIDQ